MVVSDETVEVTAEELSSPDAIVASTMVMGNGVENAIQDIVFVRPENFSSMRTREIAEEVGAINRVLVEQHRPYLLIGFGRWGSSHPRWGFPWTGARSRVLRRLSKPHSRR